MSNIGKKKYGVLIAVFISCLGCIIFGILFSRLVDLILSAKLKENLPLKNGTLAFKFWQMPPVPISFGIYVFHVANPIEVLAGTEVPVVVEKGPYIYRMHIEKVDIKWHDNNTIEYIQPQSFIFDRDSSVGPDTDRFLTVNIPYITVATILQHEYHGIQRIVNSYFISKGESAFMNRSVYEIWWGYQEPVLEEVAKILKKFNISSPLLNGKFGFFMNRNNTGDGLYNVFSGINDQFDDYVHIDRWNTLKNLSVWMSDYANEIRGTDGSMQAPLVNENSNCQFLMRICTEFATAAENPDNAGFCTPNCIPSGAYNMSVACFYAPVYASLPHFVGGDPYYQSLVRGLRPSQELHQPFYDIQGETGVSMRAARRYQINIRTQSFHYFSSFKNFPLSYLPILWIDGVAAIDPGTASMFKEIIQDPLDALPYVHGAVFGIGGILFFVGICLFIYWRKVNSKSLNKYTKVNDSENSILNGDTRKSYGTNHTLGNQLNTQHEDSPAIIEHHVYVNHTTSSPNKVTYENLDASLPHDNSHDESNYFDTMTSPSVEHSDKYHTCVET